MKEKVVISGYKLSKSASNCCMAVYLSCAAVYGWALFGIEYPPLTNISGWLAFSVAVAVNSPKLRIWVREEQDSGHDNTTYRAMSGKSEK